MRRALHSAGLGTPRTRPRPTAALRQRCRICTRSGGGACISPGGCCCSHLILIQEHVGNALGDGVHALAVPAHKCTFFHMHFQDQSVH